MLNLKDLVSKFTSKHKVDLTQKVQIQAQGTVIKAKPEEKK